MTNQDSTPLGGIFTYLTAGKPGRRLTMSTLQTRQELIQSLVCVRAQAKAYKQLASTHWRYQELKEAARK